MTIGKAKQFIQRGMLDSDLRARVLASSDGAPMKTVLVEEDLIFSDHDFDEAFHNLLTQCQSQDQADQLREFRMWWLMAVALAQR